MDIYELNPQYLHAAFAFVNSWENGNEIPLLDFHALYAHQPWSKAIWTFGTAYLIFAHDARLERYNTLDNVPIPILPEDDLFMLASYCAEETVDWEAINIEIEIAVSETNHEALLITPEQEKELERQTDAVLRQVLNRDSSIYDLKKHHEQLD